MTNPNPRTEEAMRVLQAMQAMVDELEAQEPDDMKDTLEHPVSLAEWDWVMTWSGHVLHHLAAVKRPIMFDSMSQGEGRTSCGITGQLCIPGIFSRMGAPRCKRCCKKLGWPQGVGSPKNDHNLRPLVEERLAKKEKK